MLRSKLAWMVLAGVAAAFAMLPLRAQDEEKPRAEKPSELLRFLPEDEPDNESLVLEALDRPVSLQFADLTLKDLAEAVAKKCDISVWVNEQALTDEGISIDTPITLSVSRIPLRSALDLVLHPLQLRTVVQKGVLMITTAAEAVNRRKLVVYDVTDLQRSRRSEPGTSNLVQLIQDNTGGEPDGPWQDVDGEGGTIGLLSLEDADLLVIRQTDSVHREIEQLFRDARTAVDDEDAEENDPGIAMTAAAVETRLRRRVNVNFDDVSWQTAVKTLATGIGVPVEIDASIDATAQVTLRAESAKAATILERLLKPRRLGWQVSDTGLRIVKAETLEQELELQVYDVREFFRIPADAKGLDFKGLIELIERLEGAPKTDDKAPSMTIAGTEMQGFPMLVVKAPHDRQVRIARLLKEMRAARNRFTPRGAPVGMLSGGSIF